jgi:hypothetical protein
LVQIQQHLGETICGQPSRQPSFRFAALLLPAAAAAEDFSPGRIKAGASIYSRKCSPCHDTRMQNPEAAFDLRTFPPGQHERFVSSGRPT